MCAMIDTRYMCQKLKTAINLDNLKPHTAINVTMH